MTTGGSRKANVLAVVNRKGGVAKTTTAINLAHGLSRKLLRRVDSNNLSQIQDSSRLYQYQEQYYYIVGHVLLIDFDPQGHCARGLGIDPGPADLGEVLLGRQHLSQAVISADRADHGLPRPNLWLLPASDNLERAKETLRNQSIDFLLRGYDNKEQWMLSVLHERLGLLRERFDFVIMDCAPALDVFAVAVYHFADAAIVPVKPDYLSMAGAGQHIRDIREAQLHGIDIIIHSIVPTFHVNRQRLDQQMVDELLQKHGKLVSEPIPRSQLVAESPAYQMTIFEYDTRYMNPATRAYQALVDRVYYGT